MEKEIKFLYNIGWVNRLNENGFRYYTKKVIYYKKQITFFDSLGSSHYSLGEISYPELRSITDKTLAGR